jgi:UDP-3-O-[3-hydroxymyristoyl] glucosamine N-acyltransferase
MQKSKRSVDDISALINGKASEKGLFVYGLNSLDLAEEATSPFLLEIKKIHLFCSTQKLLL